MKSAILYASFAPSKLRKFVLAPDGTKIFIRIELKSGLSDIMALEKARPRRGEITLNTIELPE